MGLYVFLVIWKDLSLGILYIENKLVQHCMITIGLCYRDATTLNLKPPSTLHRSGLPYCDARVISLSAPNRLQRECYIPCDPSSTLSRQP